MKSHLLLTFLVCELIFPVHALPALFNIRGADAPASIEGVASILNGGDFGGKFNPLTKVALGKGFGRLPLSFELNEGQTDA